ncbi:MAG: hypothetical protein DCF18_12965 [Cyanobium sp.]|nr:MAG: hypothetical protein DCF18_12965 [Cyanobium sp.]
MTVVTDKQGRLLASMFGYASEYASEPHQASKDDDDRRPMATLVCGPDQVFHEIEVPAKYEKLAPVDLHAALRQQLDQGGKQQ